MMNNEQIVEALKESGMRITRQRMIVADVIADNDGASCKDIGVIERIDMIKHTRRNGDEG
jgi:Fur family ferric uptake transcriptional regulator